MAQHYGIVAVDRTLDVLDAFLRHPEPLRLADLARVTAVNKTTLLRICMTLERRGLLQRDELAYYQLGSMAYCLGKRYEQGEQLAVVLAPRLASFAQGIGESTSFQVRTSPDTRTCICRVDVDSARLVEDVTPGGRLPLAEGATARVLRAYAESGASESNEIRQSGYSVSIGERYEGCVAISVPVFHTGGRLHGALSVFGPSSRFTPNYCRRLLPAMISTAGHLSHLLASSSGPK